MTEELYASAISEPSRAVSWLCKIHDYPIVYKDVDLSKGESRTPEFLAMSPIGKIPVLKDGDFVLTESHAIMIYLADKHGWEDWYPKDLRIRARIHEYMNWHHLNTRNSGMIVLNQLLANIGRATPEQKRMLETKDQVIADLLRSLELWLRHGRSFIASADKPTLADLSCYNELVQLELMGLVASADEEFPRLAAWLVRMKQALPHHDEVLAPMIAYGRKVKLVPADS